jgi:hypothetical protein
MKSASDYAIDRIRQLAPPTGDARRAMMDERLSPMAAQMTVPNDPYLGAIDNYLQGLSGQGEGSGWFGMNTIPQELNRLGMVRQENPEALAMEVMNSNIAPGFGTISKVGDALGDVARVADDLPMDEVSRMARAREMGFDVDTYHGTGDDIRVIDPNEFGKSQSLMGDALYSSTTTKRPNIYAQGKPDPARRGEPQDGANIMPLKVRSEGMLDLTRQMNLDESSRIAKTFENAGAEVTALEDGSFFVEYEGRSAFVDNYRPMDSNFKSLRDAFGMKNLQEVLEESGFTGVIGAEGNGNKVYANYRGQDVRSRFAKFDLRNIKSSDVLASGVGGLLGLGLMNANDAEAGQ